MANFITIQSNITFDPTSEYPVYFLGIKTRMTDYIVLLGTSLLYYAKRYNISKFDLYIIIGFSAMILSFISALKLGAGSASVCILLFAILYIIPVNKAIYTYRLLLLIIASSIVLIVPITTSYFSFDFLTDIFNLLGLEKDVTSFTGRDQLWIMAFIKIASSPYFGIAEQGVDSIYNSEMDIVLCHNQYIQLLVEAGFIGLTLILTIFIRLIKNAVNTSGFYYWFIGILLYHVVFITEVIPWNFILILMIFLIKSPRFNVNTIRLNKKLL